MPTTITATAVGDILTLSGTSPAPFIADAIAMLDGLVILSQGDPAMTQAELDRVGTYLAAYFMSVKKPRASQSSVGGRSVTRQGFYGSAGIAGNEFGQRAIELDRSDQLAEMARKLALIAMGKTAVQSTISLGSSADKSLLT